MFILFYARCRVRQHFTLYIYVLFSLVRRLLAMLYIVTICLLLKCTFPQLSFSILYVGNIMNLFGRNLALKIFCNFYCENRTCTYKIDTLNYISMNQKSISFSKLIRNLRLSLWWKSTSPNKTLSSASSSLEMRIQHVGLHKGNEGRRRERIRRYSARNRHVIYMKHIDLFVTVLYLGYDFLSWYYFVNDCNFFVIKHMHCSDHIALF